MLCFEVIFGIRLLEMRKDKEGKEFDKRASIKLGGIKNGCVLKKY